MWTPRWHTELNEQFPSQLAYSAAQKGKLYFFAYLSECGFSCSFFSVKNM